MEAATFKEADIKFLFDSQGFTCELPGDVEGSDLEISGSIITGDDRPRSIGYLRSTDPADNSELVFVGELKKDGIPISIYRYDEPDGIVLGFWHLGGGRYLTTFVDGTGGSGEERMQGVMDDLSVGMVSGLPVVLFSGDVRPGDVRDPMQRETIRAFGRGSVARDPIVELRREPPWTKESDSVRVGEPFSVAEGDVWVEASVTTRDSIRIGVKGPAESADEYRTAAGRAAETLKRSG